jgi:hypothetical protein
MISESSSKKHKTLEIYFLPLDRVWTAYFFKVDSGLQRHTRASTCDTLPRHDMQKMPQVWRDVHGWASFLVDWQGWRP